MSEPNEAEPLEVVLSAELRERWGLPATRINGEPWAELHANPNAHPERGRWFWGWTAWGLTPGQEAALWRLGMIRAKTLERLEERTRVWLDTDEWR